ncbi:hypothetical protein GCM10027612_80630 [Microbispora bryophytorum subsp. camponoti]
MVSGPHDRDRRRDAGEPSSVPPPELHHRPPGPSPWAMPPFAAPIPEDAAPDDAAPDDAPPGDDEDTRPHRTIGDAELPGRDLPGRDLRGDIWAPRPGSDAGDGPEPQARRDRGPRTGRRPYAAPYATGASGTGPSGTGPSGTGEPRHSRSGGRDPEDPGEPGDAGAPTTWHGEGARSSGEAAQEPTAQESTAQESTAPEEGRRRRIVNRPDKLVASGPPRRRRAQIPRENPDGPGAPEIVTPASGPLREHNPDDHNPDQHNPDQHDPGELGENAWAHTPPEPASRHGLGELSGIRMSPEIPVEPEHDGPPVEPVEPVERIGRPPGAARPVPTRSWPSARPGGAADAATGGCCRSGGSIRACPGWSLRR